MDKQYIEDQYHLAMLEFKTAINEDQQWEARRTMARLEALAIESFGSDFQKELRQKELNENGLEHAQERAPRRYRRGADGQVQRTWNGKLPEEFNEQDVLAFLADTDQKLNGVISSDTLAAMDQASQKDAVRFVEDYSGKIEKLVESNRNFPIEDSSIFPFEVKNGFHAAVRYAYIGKGSRFENVQAAESGVELNVTATIYKDGTLNEYDQGIEERKFTLKGTDAINEFSTKLEQSVKDSIKAHPDVQPVVTVNFSEYDDYNPLVGDHMRLSLDRANSLFELIDIVAKREASDKGHKAYYRTNADIMYVQNGEIGHFDFLQDFGRSNGSIVKHIEGYMDEQIQYWSKHLDQPDGEKRLQQWETAKKELIPYFDRHISLSRAERDLEYMGKAAAVMQDNIFEMRAFLNTGMIVPVPEKGQPERTQSEQTQGELENDLPKQVAKKDKLQETMERLETGILEIFDSERYKNYLKVMSKFHDYSINNSILIAMQRPDATRVAGYNSWKDNYHRQVRKGEKGISIIQPAPYQVKRQVEKVDPQTQEVVIGADGQPVIEEANVTVMKYKVGYVFDISQTDGQELPTIGAAELTGNVKEYPFFLRAVEQVSPVPVSFEQVPGSSKGFYHQVDKRIAVKEGMGELQSIKTLIHEIAHAKLHDRDLQGENDIDRRTKEVQAESIAYTVCQHFGLDTSDYSFAYLTSWSSGRELPELKESLETIRSTASGLIKDIERNFAELTNDREQTQETLEEKQPEQEVDGDAPQEEKAGTAAPAKEEMQPEQSEEENFPTPDPNAEPVVTIIWSEHSHFHDGETMSLSEANAVIGSLDEATTKEDGYYKTKFRIDFVMDGKPDYYGGRQDLGDGDGTLIEHIEKYHTYYENNEQWDNYLLQHGGTERLEADKAERSMLLNEFVPYLKLHENLSKMERIATQALQGNEAMTSTETAYYTAMQEYVSKCRTMVNSGDYDLPPAPQLKDFDTELEAYKEHVKEEIAQEAVAAGMTVEEYAANGYEPYTAELPDPSISVKDIQEYGAKEQATSSKATQATSSKAIQEAVKTAKEEKYLSQKPKERPSALGKLQSAKERQRGQEILNSVKDIKQHQYENVI